MPLLPRLSSEAQRILEAKLAWQQRMLALADKASEPVPKDEKDEQPETYDEKPK